MCVCDLCSALREELSLFSSAGWGQNIIMLGVEFREQTIFKAINSSSRIMSKLSIKWLLPCNVRLITTH